jgi:uncharacterized protein (TIGR01244 family)
LNNDYLQLRVLPLASDVYATGQLFETDLELVAEQGVRTVVNNRPDGEVGGQPLAADLGKAAEGLGMRYVHFPVVSGRISAEEVRQFGRLLEELEKPLLLFCRSGARSTILYEAATKDADS